jgi:uncharacterized Fe-S cluster-containing radical SAM superfamily protein
MHMCIRRVAKQLRPTDWLEKLPQSTLVKLMQRRLQIIGGIAKADCNGCMFTCTRRHNVKAELLSDADVVSYEKVPLV